MMKIRKVPYILKFSFPAGTSRGVLHEKLSWFIHCQHDGKDYFGECGLLKGLSIDDRPDYETRLDESIHQFQEGRLDLDGLKDWPSIRCGWEMILRKLESQSDTVLWESDFTRGEAIAINGLVWMGKKDFMHDQIREKLSSGFKCVKMKVGAIDFDTEIELLQGIRKEFSSDEIEIRVDANGAFRPMNALDKLKRLAELEIHSIEQPIASGQWQEMAELCRLSPIPIALDEELITLTTKEEKEKMMTTIKPSFIILKPSLIGGFKTSDEWISITKDVECGWWATSALESNVGLNAIAQWVSTKELEMPQGLGTGSLYTNNFPSPLTVSNGYLSYDLHKAWNHSALIDG